MTSIETDSTQPQYPIFWYESQYLLLSCYKCD
jgi:hypothetical protein